MNDREQRFCDEYLASGNAIKAATKAGYSQSTARFASTWLDPNNERHYKRELAEYIREHSEKMHSAKIASAEEIREFFSTVIRDPGEKTQDRIKAGELLAKIQGQFIEKVNVSGNMGVVIIDDIAKT